MPVPWVRPNVTDSAAYAANWRTVLVVDAVLGAAILLAGVIVLALVGAAAWLGVLLVGAGVSYLAVVARRARRWHRLRLARGPDSPGGTPASPLTRGPDPPVDTPASPLTRGPDPPGPGWPETSE